MKSKNDISEAELFTGILQYLFDTYRLVDFNSDKLHLKTKKYIYNFIYDFQAKNFSSPQDMCEKLDKMSFILSRDVVLFSFQMFKKERRGEPADDYDDESVRQIVSYFGEFISDLKEKNDYPQFYKELSFEGIYDVKEIDGFLKNYSEQEQD